MLFKTNPDETYSEVNDKWQGKMPHDMTEAEFEEYNRDIGVAIEKATEKKWQEKEDFSNKYKFIVGKPLLLSELNPELLETKWIWENYLAKGHITLLSALWKAGKSTLLRCMLSAIETGEEFCGQPVYPSKVLVISEEPESDWVDKREEFNLEDSKNIYVWARPIIVKPNIKQWVDFIEVIKNKCLELKIDLVVIDTLSTFWPIDNENDAAQVMKALVPLYVLTNEGTGVLLVHHFRKGGGDQGQASRGSGALPGFVTNYIDFSRDPNGLYYDRILESKGRFDGTLPKIIIRLTEDNKYQVMGQPWEVSKKARLGRIVEIFEASKDDLSVSDIFNLWIKTPGASSENISKKTVLRYIKELEEKGILSLVNSRLVGKRVTPFYALKGQYKQLETIAYPPYYRGGSVPSRTGDNPLDSLSPVNDEIVPPAEDKTTPIARGEIIVPSWEEPPEL
jgi:RecA-family ATPase